jgi:hypothetical protein
MQIQTIVNSILLILQVKEKDELSSYVGISGLGLTLGLRSKLIVLIDIK